MGPRSVERGNGRTQRNPPAEGRASMGPRSVERGNAMSIIASIAPARLQWGRVRLNAETFLIGTPPPIPTEASMGPRSVERGNFRKCDQWGRNDQCFNGAAFG